MSDVEALVDGQVFQIAFVVHDLDAALGRYTRVLGGAPWRIFTFSAAIHREAVYRGGPTDFSVQLALNGTSPQYELIEPERGLGVHRDWLDEHGEGFHHVGVIVDSSTRRSGAWLRPGTTRSRPGPGSAPPATDVTPTSTQPGIWAS